MDTDNITKILVLISAAGILYYYYRRWVDYNEALQKQTWPLRYPDCPDYWEKTADGSCQNKFNLGGDKMCPKTGRCIANTDVDSAGNKLNGGDLNKLTDEECKPFSELNCPNKEGKNGLPNACKWDSTMSASQGVIDFSTEQVGNMNLDGVTTKKAREDALHERCKYTKKCGISWEGIDQLCA